MKILVIGGTGLIGSRAIQRLTEHGHEAVSASPSSGVNTLTGEGVADAMAGVDVVIDVSNSPSFADDDVMNFFVTSTTTLLAAEKDAGVKHHVALSVVGTERLADSEQGYFRAKYEQEKLIRASRVPYSIVHTTQFFEFLRSIADAATSGHRVSVAHTVIQPMAADDVADAVARTAVGAPVNGVVEFAGPQQYRLDEIVRRELAIASDPREVVADPLARYFGNSLGEDELLPGSMATIAPTSFDDWLAAARV